MSGQPFYVSVRIRVERQEGDPQETASIVSELRDLIDELGVWLDDSQYSTEVTDVGYVDMRR